MPPSFAEKLEDFLVRNLAYFNYQNYVSRINLKDNERVLEIGCGGGNLSRFLSKAVPFGVLISIDYFDYWIDKAKKRLKNFKTIELVQEDILNFKDKDYFDLIIIHYVLHDILEKEKAVKIFKRSLKDNGRIYVREPTRIEHGVSPKHIEDLFKNEGFLKEKSKQSYSFPLKGKVYEGIFRKE